LFSALTTKEDVMGLKKATAYALLQGVQNYAQNPSFLETCKRLRSVGLIGNSIPSDRVLCSAKFSLSSLRWLIIFYFEIPGFFDMCKMTPFDVKRNESDHPSEWQTVIHEVKTKARTNNGTVNATLETETSCLSLTRAVSTVDEGVKNATILRNEFKENVRPASPLTASSMEADAPSAGF
jgi:hypothetical protein